jgi:peptidoglycan/xylan/chitin deacetylase (PgdA/CDA1 family)
MPLMVIPILLAFVQPSAVALAAPPVQVNGEREELLVIRTTVEDSLSSLAARYYGDAGKGWWIAQFNDVETVMPDQTLVIPLQPMGRGGLRQNGYQVVPVLAYERIASRPESSRTVSAAAFEEQMRFLQSQGYHPVTLDQLLEFMDFQAPLPQQAVVLTFDGADKEIFGLVSPILRRLQFPATLFVDTDSVGRKNGLTWEQIRALTLEGFEIQSHSKTGRDLTQPSNQESFADYLKALETELLGAKRTLEKNTGQKCRYLAYPHGKTCGVVIALLKKYGYRAGFTRKSGSTPFFAGNYRIQRTMITGDISMDAFKQHLKVFAESKLE